MWLGRGERDRYRKRQRERQRQSDRERERDRVREKVFGHADSLRPVEGAARGEDPGRNASVSLQPCRLQARRAGQRALTGAVPRRGQARGRGSGVDHGAAPTAAAHAGPGGVVGQTAPIGRQQQPRHPAQQSPDGMQRSQRAAGQPTDEPGHGSILQAIAELRTTCGAMQPDRPAGGIEPCSRARNR